jgi:hypothetical protein
LDVPEKELIFFIEGLAHEVRGLVLTQECTSLDEAIRYPVKYQECFDKPSRDRNEYTRKVNYTRLRIKPSKCKSAVFIEGLASPLTQLLRNDQSLFGRKNQVRYLKD